MCKVPLPWMATSLPVTLASRCMYSSSLIPIVSLAGLAPTTHIKYSYNLTLTFVTCVPLLPNQSEQAPRLRRLDTLRRLDFDADVGRDATVHFLANPWDVTLSSADAPVAIDTLGSHIIYP